MEFLMASYGSRSLMLFMGSYEFQPSIQFFMASYELQSLMKFFMASYGFQSLMLFRGGATSSNR